MSNIVEMDKELDRGAYYYEGAEVDREEDNGMIPYKVFVCKEAYKIRPAIDKPKRVKGYSLKEFGEQWIDLLECALEEHRRRAIYGKSLPDLALEKLYKQDKEIQRLIAENNELKKLLTIKNK